MRAYGPHVEPYDLTVTVLSGRRGAKLEVEAPMPFELLLQRRRINETAYARAREGGAGD